MKTFAQTLYSDSVPWKRGLVQNPEYTSIDNKIDDIEKYLQGVLLPKEYEMLEEMGNLYAQLTVLEEEIAFSYGLNMGILLMIGVMEFKNGRKED